MQTTLVPLDMWSEHAVWKQVFGKYETSLQKVQQYGELIKPSSAVVTYELQWETALKTYNADKSLFKYETSWFDDYKHGSICNCRYMLGVMSNTDTPVRLEVLTAAMMKI